MNNLIKLIVFAVSMLLYGSIFGQSFINFANKTPPAANWYSKTNIGLWVDSNVRLVKYSGDSTKALFTDANGNLFLKTATNSDSSTFVTNTILHDSLMNMTLREVTMRGNTTGIPVELRHSATIGDSATYAGRTFVYQGTSITVGQGLSSPSTERYPYLMTQYFGATEDNNAVAGSTIIACTGCGSLPTNLSRIPTYSAGDIMLFEFATNDIRYEPSPTPPMFSPTEIATWYDYVLDDAIAKGWPLSNILIMTPAYFYGNALFSMPYASYQLRQDSFVDAVEDYAKAKGVMFADVWHATEPYGMTFLNADSLHVNATGHAFIASYLDTVLQSYIGVDNGADVILNVYGGIMATGIADGTGADSLLAIDNGVIKRVEAASLEQDFDDVLGNGQYATGKDAILTNGKYRAYKGFFGDTGTISTVNPSVPNRAKLAAATDSTNFLSALRGIYAYTYGSRTTTPSGISLYSIDALAAVRSTNTQNWTIGIHPNIVGYNAIVYAETGATGTSGYASCFSGTLAAQNGTSSTHTFDIAAGFTMDYGSAKYNHTYGVHLFQCDRGAISNAYILGTAGISHTPPANKTLFIYDTTGYQSAIVNGGVFSIGNSFNYGNGSLFQLTGRGYIQGLLKYAGDSSANYDARTLIDKGYADATYAPISGSANYEVPLTFSTGLTRTTNTITNNLSTGVAGGQTVYGGTATGDDLTIRGTINGSPSGANVLINTAGGGDLALGSTTTHLSSVSAARTFTISNAAERSIIEYNRPSDAIADNDAIGQFDWWEGSATPRQVAAIVGFASGTNEDAGKLAFYTRESGGSTTARMIINHLGNIGMGMGLSNPSAFLNVRGTSEQLRLDYDASNYVSTTVSSTGGVTYNAVGSGQNFTFSDNVTVSGVATANMVRIPYTPTSAGTLSPAVNTNYYFNGTTSTWTLPVVTGNNDNVIMVRNAGTGTITVNSNAGGNDIVITTEAAAGNTVNILSGEQKTFQNRNNTYWVIY